MEQTFKSLMRSKEKPILLTFSSMIMNYGKARLKDNAEWVYKKMNDMNYMPSFISYECMIMLYGYCCSVSRARDINEEDYDNNSLDIDLNRNLAKFPQLKPEEITGINKDFEEAGFLAPTGLFLGGVKYMVVQGEQGAVIRGKKGPGGVTIKKTNQALVIGIYDEPMTGGQCNLVVERLGDYLMESDL